MSVKILCDLRLVAVLLMIVAIPQVRVGGLAIATVLLTLPLSWLLLRHWEPLGARLIQGWTLPAVESAVAILLLLSFGATGIGAAYLGATLALLSCGGGLRPTLISLGSFAAAVALVVFGAVPLPGGVGAIQSFWMLSLLVLLGACSVAGLHLRRMLFARVELVERRRVAEIAEASSQERLRLAQDLHDGMAKTLHGCHLLSASLTRQLERQGLPLAERAHELTSALDTARRESRELLLEIRKVPGGDLVPPCRAQLHQWAVANPGIKLRLRLPEEPIMTGVGVQRQVAYVVGELLENVRRHSRSPAVAVELEEGDGKARFRVTDDGIGMGALDLARLQRAGHFGLAGVHERLQRIGGTCHIESVPGRTSVAIEFPVDQRQGRAA